MEALLGGHGVCHVEEIKRMSVESPVRAQQLFERGPRLSLQLVEPLLIRINYFDTFVYRGTRGQRLGRLRRQRRHCWQSATFARARVVAPQALRVRSQSRYAPSLAHQLLLVSELVVLKRLLRSV